MHQTVETLLKDLERFVEGSYHIPMSQKVVVDAPKFFLLLDTLHETFLDEVEEARELVKRKTSFIKEAEKQAEGILKGAQKEAEHRLSEHEITLKANALRSSTEEYAEEILGMLEGKVSHLLQTIENGKKHLCP